MAINRIILHIDMDSYFATVEQQANPLLRGKPIVVSGKEGSRTVIVASSKEAKKFGVKTAMAHFQAKKLCPHLEFVEPDGAKYEYFCRQFIKIFKKYTEKVEVFSIDEAFLDLTGYAKNFEQAKKNAWQIKKQVKNKLGEWVTCSVGIAKNKLLAKLASDLDKPNGLFLISEKNKEQVLKNIKLTDFCGIGRRLEKRLDELGINSVEKLKNYPKHALIREFGPFQGNKLYNMSRGIDNDPVVSYLETDEVKSVGRSYTLPHDTWEKQEIFTVLMHLCERTGRELRRKNLAGRTLVYYLRNSDFTHIGFRKTIEGYTNSTLQLFEIGENKFKSIKLKKPVRLVGVHVSNLIKDWNQLPLWQNEQKKFQLTPYLDKINDRYGELTIKPAYLLKQKRLRRKVGGFKLAN